MGTAGGGTPILAYKKWGNGIVFFGGVTLPFAWTPSTEGQNLWQNIFSYVKQISICALSAAAITPTTPQTVCSGSTLTLNGSSTGSTSPAYTWSSIPSGFSSNEQNPAFTVPTVTSVTDYTLTLTVTEGSCSATTTKQITVNPIPTAVATPSIQTICSASAMTTMAFTGNVAGTVYHWTRDNTDAVTGLNGSGSGDISGTLTNTTNTPVTVTFTITPAFTNAGTTCNGTPITATVTVNPLPLAMISGTTTVCQNDPVPSITFTGSRGIAPYTFTYTLNNTSVQTVTTTTGNSVTLTVPTDVSGLFVYTLVNVKESGPAQCSQNQNGSAIITIKPTPTSALTASQTDVCPNTQVTLEAHCSLPTAIVNWNPGAPTVTPNAPTTPYTYKASCTFDGCTGNESSVEVRTHRILADLKEIGNGTQPQPILKTVKDNLSPTNTFSAPANARRWTIIAKGCATSESAGFKLSGPVNFTGIDNDTPYALFSNEGNNYYAIDHPNYGTGGSFPNGTYTLTVDLRSQDGVGGPFPKNRVATGALLATRTLQFTVEGSGTTRQAAKDNKQTGDLMNGEWNRESGSFAEVAPNPVTKIMQLKIKNTQGQKVSIRLTDVTGRILLQGGFVPETNQHQEEFEVGHLANGIYFLKVNTADQQTTVKVLKTE
ncbi:MAG: T9SS type A sorting domain-containing protein [Spirosomataceae bacterium]